jgi:PKD repeat protein
MNEKIVLSVIVFYFSIAWVHAQQAGFTVNQTSKCAPSRVGFVNTSTGNPNSYQWDFGDGFTATAPNPTHPYTNAGTYMVQLIAF